MNVTVSVRKLSDEYEPTGNKIVRNQNVPVTNDDLKTAVTISNNGNSKVKSVTPVGTISTTNAGTSTIKAAVTYLDDTTDPVDIPLEVKDVTAPTIQTPSDRQNWDLIALDRTLPSITVTSVDNNGGTGIKSTTVTGLPDFLVYDNTTKTIKFKNGVQEVTKLPVGQDSKTYTATIQVTDNANNPSQRQVTITVKSMTTKYNATPNGQKQTVSYGATPDAGTSINKNGLPAGTTYTWTTTPSTTTGPGEKAGVVTVTYPDGSKDTVNVTVNVRRLADEYAPTGTKITREQNTAVTNEDLKAAVTMSNNGNNKVKSVTPVGTISTAEFGNKTINATVTYLDDTTDPVTIPLEVKDVTKPTIQTPKDRQNWDLIALDRTLPSIKVTTTDNPGGSGVKSTTVTGLPNFLTYDEATKTIKFKNGVQEVTKLPVGTNEQSYNVTIQVTDNANNSNSIQVTITVKSMMTKFNPAPLPQTVDNGTVPDAEASVDKKNAPSGTTVRWKETPEVTTPGEHTGVAIVHYPDGSEEEVDVPITVKPQKDTYDPVGKPQTVDNGTVPEAEASVDKKNAPSGTTVRWKETPEVTTPGAHKGVAIVHYPDGSEEEVDVPVVLRHSNEKGIPEVQSALPEFAGGVNGDPEAQSMLPEFNGGVNGDPEAQPMLPEFVRGVNGEPEAQPMLPEFNGGVNGDPEVQSTLPEFAGGVNGEPEAQPELSEYTGGVNGEPEAHPTLSEFVGGVNGDPEVQPVLPEFAGGVNGDPEVQLALLEFSGGVNGDPEAHPTLPEFNGGVNGDPEVHPMLPEFNGGVNGESEAQPTLPEFNGGVNGDSEVQPTLPEYTGGVNGEPEAQPSLPEFVGGVNGEPEVQPALPEYAGGANDKSEIRSSFRDKTSNVATKRLANTGQSQNNSELAGLGLMIVGLFAAIKRRKNEEE